MPQIHELTTATGTLGSTDWLAVDNGTSTKKVSAGELKSEFVNTTTLKSIVVDLIYPVGSIYMSTDSTSPATLFGGTWSKIEGKFLIGASSTYTAGTAGGSSSYTLTESNLPQITGSVKFASNLARNATGASSILESASGKFSRVSSSSQNAVKATNVTVDTGVTLYTTVKYQFGQSSPTAVDTMPPYLPVYIWKRTA